PMASSSPTGRRPGRRSGLVDDLGARRVLLDRLDRLEGRALLRVLLAAREDVAVRRDDAEPELAALLALVDGELERHGVLRSESPGSCAEGSSSSCTRREGRGTRTAGEVPGRSASA